MFINTTPHVINLRFTNGDILAVPPSTDEKLNLLFRCKAVSEPRPPLVLDGRREISMISPPRYTLDMQLWIEVFGEDGGKGKEVETFYLISTIAAMALEDSGFSTPNDCRFVVPYSGPIPGKCLRENGSIVWVAELMDYSD